MVNSRILTKKHKKLPSFKRKLSPGEKTFEVINIILACRACNYDGVTDVLYRGVVFQRRRRRVKGWNLAVSASVYAGQLQAGFCKQAVAYGVCRIGGTYGCGNGGVGNIDCNDGICTLSKRLAGQASVE